MYYFTIKIQFLVLVFVDLILIKFVEADTSVAESILDELYLKYKEAVSDGWLQFFILYIKVILISLGNFILKDFLTSSLII